MRLRIILEDNQLVMQTILASVMSLACRQLIFKKAFSWGDTSFTIATCFITLVCLRLATKKFKYLIEIKETTYTNDKYYDFDEE